MSLAIAFSREKRLLQFYEVPEQQLSVERRGYCNSTMSLAIAFSREKRLLQFYEVPSNSFQQREEVTAILRGPQQQLSVERRGYCNSTSPQQQLSVERRGYFNSTRSPAIAFSREKRLLQFYDVPSNSFQQREEVTAILRGPQQQLSVERRGYCNSTSPQQKLSVERRAYCNSTRSLAIAFSREKRLLQFYESLAIPAILRGQQQLSVERRGYCNSTMSLAIAFSREKRLLQFYEVPSNSFQQREEVTAILRCPQQQLSVERRGYCNSTRSLAIAFSREKRLLQFYDVPSNSFQQREEVTAILRCPQQQLSVERRGYCNSTRSLAIAFSREKRLLQFYDVPSNSFQQRKEVTAILRGPQQQLPVERRGYCNSTMSLAIAFSREKRLLQFYEVPSNSFQQREEVTAILRCPQQQLSVERRGYCNSTSPQQQLSVERRGYCNSTRSLAIAFSREKRLLQFYEVPSNSFQQREEVTAILRCPQQQLSAERRGSFQQRKEITAILRGPQQQLSVERRGYCNSTMPLAIAFSREKRLLQFYVVPSNSFQQREEVTAILRGPQQQLSVERRGYCNSTMSLAIAFSREEVTAILRCPQQQLSVERRGYCNSTRSLTIAFSREKRLVQFYDVPSNSFQSREEITAILRGPQQQLSVERGYCNSTRSLAIAFSREKRLLQFYDVPSNSFQQREEVTAILRGPQQQLSVERRGYCNSTMSLAIAFSREKRLLQFYEVPSNSIQQREEVTAILRCPQQQLSVERRGYCNSTMSLAIAFSREKRLLQFYDIPSNSFQQREEVTAILRGPQQQHSVERRGYCNSTMSIAIAFSREKRLLQFYDVPSNSFQQREEVTAILRGPQQQLSVERRGYCNSTMSPAIAFSREKRLLQFYEVPSNSFQQREEVTAILLGP